MGRTETQLLCSAWRVAHEKACVKEQVLSVEGEEGSQNLGPIQGSTLRDSGKVSGQSSLFKRHRLVRFSLSITVFCLYPFKGLLSSASWYILLLSCISAVAVMFYITVFWLIVDHIHDYIAYCHHSCHCWGKYIP